MTPRPSTAVHRVAATLITALLLCAGSFAAPASIEYSLSVEVEYGRKPSRRTYLEEMRRRLEAWVGSRGTLHAPVERGMADLHLQVVVDEVDRGRGYPEMSGERDVFIDTPGSATSPYVYHTRFELRVTVLDPRQGDQVVVQQHFTIYNETRETKVASNPEQRSWDDNLRFMEERIRRFLSRRDDKIQRYLRNNPRRSDDTPEPR